MIEVCYVIESRTKISKSFFAKSSHIAYTSGAYLVPMAVKDREEERFVWVVEDFNDETYVDGELCSTLVYAYNIDELMGAASSEE